LEKKKLLFGLDLLKYQYLRGKQASFVCLKVRLIFVKMIFLLSTLTQESLANLPQQRTQHEDKDSNDPQEKGCPTRLLGDFHNGANRHIADGDAKTGCSRKQAPYSIPDNLTGPHGLATSLTQSSCQILIFVSFSMPEASLKNLAQEVVRNQGNPCHPILVMRGLYQDSFVKTAEKLKSLVVSVDINPELFDAHQVTAVPTFIFVKDGKPLLRLKGNVTLAFVKDRFGFRDQEPGLMHARNQENSQNGSNRYD
jgi:type-F conjugative transfer system pilin assembly protein TrbC